MALGGFDKRVIASAKLAYVEKYKFAYSADISLIKDALYSEVEVSDIVEGIVCINHRGSKYNVEIRDYIPPAQPKVEVQGAAAEKAAEAERAQNKWVSIWDAAAKR
jgi:hypothetical protein